MPRSKYLSRRTILILLLILGALVIPLLARNVFIFELLIVAYLYGAVCVSWSMVLGYGGIFSFATLALFVLGGYMSGILSIRFGINPWGSMLLSSLITMSVGLAVAASLLRLKGFIVGLCTFSFQFLLLAIVVRFDEYTGGYNGLVMIPPLWSGLDRGQLAVSNYVLAFAILVGTVILMHRISVSKFGVAVRAYRDNEEYAVTLGIYPARLKVMLFAISSSALGFAGAFQAHHMGFMAPDMLSFSTMLLLIVALVFGGLDNILQCCLSAIILTILMEALSITFPTIHLVLLGVLVMITILVSRQKIRKLLQYISS